MASKEARARIGLDTSAFEKGGAAVLKTVNAINTSIKTIAAVTGGAFLFGKAIEGALAFKNAIWENITASLKFGEELANLAHGTGAAAGALYTMQFAMEKGISNERAARMLGNEAKILSENAALFRDTSIKLSVIGERVKGFWLGVTEKAAPLLDRVFDKIINFNFASWGEKLAEPFANAGKMLFQIFEEGNVLEMIIKIGDLLGGVLIDAFKYAFQVATTLFDYFTARLSVQIKNSMLALLSGPGDDRARLKLPDSPTLPDHVLSDNTNAQLKTITSDLGRYLDRFNSKSGLNRLDPFESKKAYKNFGVDSLQSIGGGGGAGGGFGLVDIATQSLNVQKDMLRAIQNAGNEGVVMEKKAQSSQYQSMMGYTSFLTN
jgi:hypothetical protein